MSMTQQSPDILPNISPAARECFQAAQMVKTGKAAEGIQILREWQQRGRPSAGLLLGELYAQGVRDRTGHIVLKRSASDARREYQWALDRTENNPRAHRRIEAKLESLPKDVASTVEKSYHTPHEATETNADTTVIEPPPKTLLEKTTAFLADIDVAAPQRPAFAQLIDIARANPEAALAAVEQALQPPAEAATHSQPEAQQTWHERVAGPEQQERTAIEGQPKQKGGRKRKDPPPTEADLKEGNRILWLVRVGKDVDPEALKKAERNRRWVYNEKKRQQARQEAELAAVQQALQATPEAAQTGQEREAQEPPQQRKASNRGRRRIDPPPNDERLKEVGSILWQARMGKNFDAETLKKARRDQRWAERHSQTGASAVGPELTNWPSGTHKGT